MSNIFFFPNVNIYLLTVTVPKGISRLMKLAETLFEKATMGAEWHLFTVLPVHC